MKNVQGPRVVYMDNRNSYSINISISMKPCINLLC